MKRIIASIVCLFIIMGAFTVYANDEIYNKYFATGELYYAKAYDECIKSAEELLKYDDSHMEAYYFLSMAAFRTGNYELAYQTFKRQLEKNPNNELALYNAACTASVMKKENESIDFIKRLLAIDITNKSSIKSDSDFDNIRNNAEYKRLMEISVVFGGELVQFDVAPLIVDGRTLLPVRKVFECMGAEVTYDDKTRTAIAKKDDTEIRIAIDNKIATVNGQQKELDVSAMIVEGRTLVPVRFVGEALNAKVDWDGTNRVVSVMMPAEHGTAPLSDVQSALETRQAVSVVDGIFPHPYTLMEKEGQTMIIFKDAGALKMFSSLAYNDKLEYMRKVAYDNFALVVGCSDVYVKVIYDGKTYYQGTYKYDDNKVSGLVYYSKGKPENVIKQYKSTMNYKDFYKLPVAEQITSKIGD